MAEVAKISTRTAILENVARWVEDIGVDMRINQSTSVTRHVEPIPEGEPRSAKKTKLQIK